MRSKSSITVDRAGCAEPLRRLLLHVGGFALVSCVLLASASNTAAQRVAVITAERNPRTIEYAERVASALSSSVRLLDSSLVDAAFRSVTISDPFNMSVAEGRAVASAVGCDHLLLIRAGSSRRSSFARPEYYEAFATHYLVSGRTGNLLLWRLRSFDADDQQKADRDLNLSIDGTAGELVGKMRSAARTELATAPTETIEELPMEGSPAAINFKPPVPYRRIKPAYPVTAFLYDVRATVEIEADIGAEGTVLSTRVARWAGFGLEESAEIAIRAMNWRPAMRKGKPLPMRVLLRYNFTKVDKE